MRLTSEREQVRSVAANWKGQYFIRGEWIRAKGGVSGEVVYRQLAALDVETATAEDVAKIIGNTSWVHPEHCRECGHRGWDVVQLGEELGHESYTTYACRGCLAAALRLADGSVSMAKAGPSGVDSCGSPVDGEVEP